MTRNVATCKVDDTVETVLNLMRERGVRHVPVTDQGKLVTMISMRDLLHYSAEQAKRDIDSLTSFIFGVGYR
ncbi:MAG: CBS domain-containing protein [Proteobacteria bacterium]|nr:CBS domain-containing protein [Pseudomonadota bacterium]